MGNETFEVVARYDEAIDVDALSDDTRRKFRETGDLSGLKYTEGKLPQRFFCRRLRVSEMQAVNSTSSEPDMYAAAFARGVVKVLNLRDEHGSVRTWTRPDADRALSTKELEASFDYGDIQEIGARIHGASILGKGRPAVWRQPAISVLATVARGFHHAEQTREKAASSPPSNPSPEEPPPATECG